MGTIEDELNATSWAEFIQKVEHTYPRLPDHVWTRLHLNPNWKQKIDHEQDKLSQQMYSIIFAKRKQAEIESPGTTKRKRTSETEVIQLLQAKMKRLETKLDTGATHAQPAANPNLPDEDIEVVVTVVVRCNWDGTIPNAPPELLFHFSNTNRYTLTQFQIRFQ